APTDYAGEFSKALDENLSEINAGLAEAGLPPLSQKQIAATRAKLDQMAKELSSFEKNVQKAQKAQEPELASVLREAGISETKIADMEKAMTLPMPDPALCRTESEWKLLVDQYLERFSSLLRPSKGMLETMRTTFLMQGPWGAAAAESLAEEQMRPEAVLSKIGMKPEKAAEFVRLLDQDLPEDPKTMNAFLADLEEAGGFPKGRLAEKMAAYESLLAKNGFSLKAPAQKPPAPAEAAGAQKTETASPEAEKMAEQGAPEEEEKKFTAESSPPTTREEVLLWLAGGHVLQGLSLASVDLSGLDLSGQDMRDVDLSGGSLAGTRLNGANLSGAVLKKCDCTGANFTSASLRGASLSGATFDKAVLAETDMSGADATSVRARDAEFSKAVLAKTTLANGIFSDATFEHVAGEGVDAKGASFANARFRFCRFPSMRCEKADFSGADLHDSDFSGALFQGAVLKNASLCYGTRVAGADFEGAVLEDAVCTSVNGEGASFRAVSALKAVFSDSLFTASDWSGADLRFGDFSRSLLSASSMEGANLFQGVLREADLSSARLGNASLYGVDMTRMKTDGRTVFDNADLTNTILNARERGL
ncbi:MAG: pentapeptide repeat-containing protein, partial [Desulfovibrio sp.]|nr:pentapeptide repeat-containing protein [Desulfovibrio sp.]